MLDILKRKEQMTFWKEFKRDFKAVFFETPLVDDIVCLDSKEDHKKKID